MRFLGIDLAWGEGTDLKPASRSGVVALEPDGRIVEAGWTVGIADTERWIEQLAAEDTLLFVDAPLVVTNETGQRLAEKQVGQRYGRWWVSANSTNTQSSRRAGVHLRRRLEASGWIYSDGRDGPPDRARTLSECYPYTTIVGVEQLGYDDKRPAYKRATKGTRAAQAWPIRTAACDELIRRLANLRDADPPLDLSSHPETLMLTTQPSPPRTKAYKQREDLLDAAICAWTAAYWAKHGLGRCQVLGVPENAPGTALGTIIAPTRDSQRG